MACNRPTVSKALDKLLAYRPSAAKFPIVVSQDCGHAETKATIQRYGQHGVQLIEQPDLGTPKVERGHQSFVGYYKISRHYKWALTQMFDVKHYDAVIIVEDDLEIAPDFFEYMTLGNTLLQRDPTLWCISDHVPSALTQTPLAWNDNGKENYVKDPAALFRSDFFGGLGWLLRKNMWDELRDKWPKSFWDDWIRDNAQRKNRACIRPEVPRTGTFGRIGVSQGQFYDQHLKFIKPSKVSVPFSQHDPSPLTKEIYDPAFITRVYETAELLSASAARERRGDTLQEYRIEYDYASPKSFETLARTLGIMSDWKDGVPRTAYMGVVTFVYHGARYHLAPHRPWTGYKTDHND
ncbi:uncharacterized protein MONBRDRAFT_28515 [Monosiga brevicollis MX1]|uniref:alpha-1,3-mannosyl-glycoprotein 2-beta-N-acetylglucosaminyltransferase n=1 Tax=Monosiga brevicollis TaxID=81824 RepID=A9V8E2_MONBE|nr:uncharacterized protein MONBRDRAFT_28515 [Monosiga brevicollis MX1]EDQ86324.1 predicted protein [Monosiga brevicollis MX1]|eukprot:XP_001748994.1 hypothetical protein [Monosiga brevicollis MX1]